jgi:hypothetical protein
MSQTSATKTCGPHLWAKLYWIESTPFFIFDVSRGDVVLARADDDGGILIYQCMLTKSGHNTVRARVLDCTITEEKGEKLVSCIQKLGCESETLDPRLIAIDAPPECSLREVSMFLTMPGIYWEYADPTNAADSELTGFDTT